MMSANAYGKVVVDFCGWHMFMSMCNLAFRIGEMRRLSRAWSSTESKEVGREVISNAPLGMASRLGLAGWVVEVV